MKKKVFFPHLIAKWLFLMSPFVGYSQMAVNGPDCAIAAGVSGVSYSVSGDIQTTDQMTWKITGGVLVSGGSATISGIVSSIGRQVRIIWSPKVASGQIDVVNSRLGSATFSVNIITMDTAIGSAVSLVNPNSPISFTGGMPSDTTCTSSYSYWWEVSDNLNGPFIRVVGEFSHNLTISSLIKKSFYRRVINVNGDNFYSNVMMVDIDASLK
ncbi:MAG TPA: hypothetical protein VK543_18750 [Puia sp.]|nr:hypothetical protein [Puia sp.]